jgi:putative ABC transport system permease protein
MDLQPILAALRKHRIPAGLIVLEIALACAVLCNAVFMIGQRVGEMHVPNAIDESGIVDISVQGANPQLAGADVPRNLAALREISGVTAVAAINIVPLGQNGWNANVATKPGELMEKDSPNVAQYMFSRGGPEALGMRLVQGRWFNDAEYANGEIGASYLPNGSVVLVTRSLAERLWPGQSALGKDLWIGDDNHYLVVGVVADVLRPSQNGEGAAGFHRAIFLPVRPAAVLGHYIVRAAPDNLGRVLREGVGKLEALGPNTVVKGQTFPEIRDRFFADARSMIWMLVLVCAVMLAVTAFGIVGLTSFWVGQRRRQIGIRRALGATRSHIMRYFQAENFLLTAAGVLCGMALAFGINVYLMRHYEMPRMPAYYLPAGAMALWLLGQLAVMGPARRAAAVPPVVATRTG